MQIKYAIPYPPHINAKLRILLFSSIFFNPCLAQKTAVNKMPCANCATKGSRHELISPIMNALHMVQIVHVESCPRKSLLFQTLLIYPIAYCRYIAHILPCTRTCDMVEIVQGYVTWWKLCKDM